jgi:hypothetical protein
MADLQSQQDKLAAENLILKDKAMNLFDVLRMTWEEHQAQGAEDEALLEQLVAENRGLREMLRIA